MSSACGDSLSERATKPLDNDDKNLEKECLFTILFESFPHYHKSYSF